MIDGDLSLPQELDTTVDILIIRYCGISTVNNPISGQDNSSRSNVSNFIEQLRDLLVDAISHKVITKTVDRESEFDGEYFIFNLSTIFQKLQTEYNWFESEIIDSPFADGQIYENIRDNFNNFVDLKKSPISNLLDSTNSFIKFDIDTIIFSGNMLQLGLFNTIIRNLLYRYPRFASNLPFPPSHPFPIIINAEIAFIQYKIFPDQAILDFISRQSVSIDPKDLSEETRVNLNLVIYEHEFTNLRTLSKLYFFCDDWTNLKPNDPIHIFIPSSSLPKGIMLDEKRLAALPIDFILQYRISLNFSFNSFSY